MGSVPAKGLHADYEVAFQGHMVGKNQQSVYDAGAFGKSVFDSASLEYGPQLPEELGGVQFNWRKIFPFFLNNDVFKNIQGREFDLVVVDVPFTGQEYKSNARRVGAGKLFFGGGLFLVSVPAILKAIDLYQGKKGLPRISESRAKKGNPSIAAKLLSRREFFGALGTSAGLIFLSQVLSPLTFLPTALRAALHGVSKSFIVEGRSAVMAERLEAYAALLGKQIHRRPKIFFANVGPDHGGIIKMLENHGARKKVLVNFFDRIQQIPEAYHRRAFVFTREPKKGLFSRREIELPPLFSSGEMERLRAQRQKSLQGRRSPRRIEDVRMTRREALGAFFGRRPKRPQRRA